MNNIIFLDMDGVLVDLHTPIIEQFQLTDVVELSKWNNGELGVPDEVLWAGKDEEWWASLGWTNNGRDILDTLEKYVGVENIVICTKPANARGSCDGKLMWIERNIPQYSKRYMLMPEKWWAANPYRILIDDSERNVDAFRAAGGLAHLVPRLWNRDRDKMDTTLLKITRLAISKRNDGD